MLFGITVFTTSQSCEHRVGVIRLPCRGPLPSAACEVQDRPVSQAPPLIQKPLPFQTPCHSPAIGQTEVNSFRLFLPTDLEKDTNNELFYTTDLFKKVQFTNKLNLVLFFTGISTNLITRNKVNKLG